VPVRLCPHHAAKRIYQQRSAIERIHQLLFDLLHCSYCHGKTCRHYSFDASVGLRNSVRGRVRRRERVRADAYIINSRCTRQVLPKGGGKPSNSLKQTPRASAMPRNSAVCSTHFTTAVPKKPPSLHFASLKSRRPKALLSALFPHLTFVLTMNSMLFNSFQTL